MDPIDFLSRVWRVHAQSGYGFISVKGPDGSWTDHPIKLHRGVERTKATNAILDSEGDLYFTPCLFDDKRRLKTNALPGRWLYADLDEVDPRKLGLCPPTVAWRSSPGRYQALWLLDEAMAPRALQRLNQKLTYFTEADKGGWSLTKVLRIPGTVNHKYPKAPAVKALWFRSGVTYSRAQLTSLTRDVDTPADATPSLEGVTIPELDDRKVRRLMRDHKVGARARKLVRATEARGDRSQRLWELENALVKAGLRPEHVVAIARRTVWNKYAGQQREIRMLWTEVTKAQAQLPPKKSRSPRRTRTKPKPQKRGLFSPQPLDRFLLSKQERPNWLVEGIWSENAHGVLAGQAKVYKSLFAMDLGISIASGFPFLGRFHVPRVGPVLYIQEENDSGLVFDRMHRIAASKGIGPSASLNGHSIALKGPDDIPFEVMNQQGFNLTEIDHLKWLARYAYRVRPALIILDPLYRMAPNVNENSAEGVNPLLDRLSRIKQATGCGIQVVHHYNKPTADNHDLRPGHRISGTSLFHRWLASAIYVNETSERHTVLITGEHRAHSAIDGYEVTFDLGEDEGLDYNVAIKRHGDEDDEESTVLRDLVESEGGRVRAKDIAEELDMTVRQVVRLAKASGLTTSTSSSKTGRAIFVKAG